MLRMIIWSALGLTTSNDLDISFLFSESVTSPREICVSHQNLEVSESLVRKKQ